MALCERCGSLVKKKATRSLQANAYYFGVVLSLLSEYTGYEVEELHEHFKREFIPKDIVLCDGHGEVRSESRIGGSTRRMNVNEFYEYVEKIRRAAAEMGVVIPDPVTP